MKKPTTLLALAPVLALLAVPSAEASHPSSHKIKKKLVRLADDVSDGARLVYRSVAGRHDRHNYWGPGRRHGFYGQRDELTLTALANLELRAHEFERALQRRPLDHTHREYENLVRAFDYAADALYRVRVAPAVERDFECLAEYMFTLAGTYEEYAYPRRARYRGDDRGGFRDYGPRIEIYTPRWNPQWRQESRRGWDRDWDSDSDSDSY